MGSLSKRYLINNRPRAFAIAGLFCFLSACGDPAEKAEDLTERENPYCSKTYSAVNIGSTGKAYAFLPDPIISSDNEFLSAAATNLDDYKTIVTLANLSGKGLLSGAYVDIRNLNQCDGGYGAYSGSNDFLYSHSDSRFQEAMTYHFGDGYRSQLARHDLLLPAEPMAIVVHCQKDDNAGYLRFFEEDGSMLRFVCIGDSAKTPGASYADDATVVLHELQHATTVEAYSPQLPMNQLLYDEAGTLNEAISDALGLMYLEPLMSGWDPRVFSRWALGSFIPGVNDTRGAHRCPTYDPGFPDCAHFQAGTAGFSASQNHVSYVYPDGLGWSYSNNFVAPGYLKSAFSRTVAPEQIHGNSILVTGALWDIYAALKALRGPTETVEIQTEVFGKVASLVMKAVGLLPKPTSQNLSPVTFIGFAEALLDAMTLTVVTDEERIAIEGVLRSRGLIDYATLGAGWAQAGPGSSANPGLYIQDETAKLKDWASMNGVKPTAVPSTLLINGLANPGEMLMVWFDIRNLSTVTAGGPMLTVTSGSADLEIVDSPLNVGALDGSAAQVMLAKINGTAIVQALTSDQSTYHVDTSNTYFRTNPYFFATPLTGVWVRVSAQAARGSSLPIQVTVTPANGPTETLQYAIKVN